MSTMLSSVTKMIKVLRHGPYGFYAEDETGEKNWYTPGKTLNKTDFQPNMKYAVETVQAGKKLFVNKAELVKISQSTESTRELPPLPHEITKKLKLNTEEMTKEDWALKDRSMHKVALLKSALESSRPQSVTELFKEAWELFINT